MITGVPSLMSKRTTSPSSVIAAHYNSTFASNNTALSAYFTASRLGVIGVSAYLVDFGSQEVSVGPGGVIGRISLKNIELLASYATELGSHFAPRRRRSCAGASA